MKAVLTPHSEMNTPTQKKLDVLTEGNFIQKQEKTIYAQDPIPRNPAAARGKSLRTPADVSVGVKFLHMKNIQRHFDDAGWLSRAT